jgi:phenylalanyl-tRNA synthetase beta chain
MNGNVRLFEIGTTFSGTAKGALPTENIDVAAVIMGLRRPVHFTEPQPPAYDQWDAKEIAEAVATSVYPRGDLKLVVSTHGFLWDILLDGERVGSVQQLSLDAPVWASPAFGVEMLIKPEAAVRAEMKYRGLPATPAVEFDLALLVPENVVAEKIEASIRKNAGELLENLEVFDEFKGKGIPDGFRSLAWRLTFRHPERTLRDKEIQGRTDKILKALDSELGIKKRS